MKQKALCQKNLKRYARMLEKLLAEDGSLLAPEDRKDALELVAAV